MVPSVLRKFIPGQPELIPYVKEAPDRTENTPGAAKGKAVPIREKN